jgi:hypothetical protein
MNDNYLRYFDPEVPAEEKERMLRELSLDPDQKKEFEAILKTWSYTSVADFALEELNTSQEYNALISRLNN